MDNERVKVFNYLCDLRSVPITVTIGTADDHDVVRHTAVIVHNAPPRVVQEIVSTFNLVSLRPDGLYIPVTE